MGYVEAAKLNIFPSETPWGRLPLAFFGSPIKNENEQELTNRFVDANGKSLLCNFEAFMLGIIRSLTQSVGKCTLTYEGWSNVTGRCGKTIWTHLKDLEENDFIERLGQSTYRYKVREGVDDIDKAQVVEEENALNNNYLPLAYFVFEDWIMKRRKKIGKKDYTFLEKVRHLSPTADLVLLLFLRHENNPDKAHKYYIAGEVQIANTLNKPQSMVHAALEELISAGFIYRNYVKVFYDAQGRVTGYGKVTQGKGVNRYCRSCFILDEKIRKVKLEKANEKKNSVAAILKVKPITTDNDVLIEDLMTFLNCKRSITDKDRRKVMQWFEWGFDNEMIKAAAQIAEGKACDAVRYVHGILKNWRSERILTIDDVHKKALPKKKRSILEQWGLMGEAAKELEKNQTLSTTSAQQGLPSPDIPKNYNLRIEVERHYFDLKHKAEEAAEEALNRAKADEVYCGIRKRLNELSVKLAFAELHDKAAAEQISAEIKELEEKGDKRLAELGIDKADFEPHFSCTICNDTGYDKYGKPCKCLKEFIKNIK